MAKKHVMTAARKRALRKAQLASAKKRRKGIRRRTIAKKSAIAAKKYSGPGGRYKMHRDRYHSRGIYSTNWKGKKLGKTAKRINKIGGAYLMMNPGYSGVVAASYINGRRKGTIKKRKRR